MNKKILSLVLISASWFLISQEKKITLQDLWVYYRFIPKSPDEMYVLNDGEHYIRWVDSGKTAGFVKIPIRNPNQSTLLVSKDALLFQGKEFHTEDFSFSPDESMILFKTDINPIYRYSAKTSVYIYSIKKKKVIRIPGENSILFPAFSPDSKKLAYVKNNNLYVYILEEEKEIQITSDGQINKIKNGWGDWVYEEEFSKPDYFCWDASSEKLAFLRFDESHVKEYTINYYRDSLYPLPYTFKYPKAGEDNSLVSCHVYDLKSGHTHTLDIGKEKDIYLPRLFCMSAPHSFCLLRLNRRQNKLEYIQYDSSGQGKVILTDSSDTYVDVHDEVFFYKNQGMFFLSERSGYQHVHYLDFRTSRVQQIISGNYDVTKVYGVDEKNGILYYQSAENGPQRRDVFSIRTDGSNKKKLSPVLGFNDASFYAGMKYFVLSHSDANSVPQYYLMRSDGTKIRTLEDNMELKSVLKEYKISRKEFFSFKNRNGTILNGWMLKPKDFDSTRKYPVYMFAYNGPGSNEVNDSWEGLEVMWHQLLCQEGFIVVCVDGRGTMCRGSEFKHCTYMQLGGPESDDQIDAARYLGSLSYVDSKRIMFQGWSYGGFMATLLITKGADYFAGAVAVAPVTNWKFYDNIYTERYMRKPSENKEGYEKNTPMHYVKKYKGGLLLIHGDADDNVHIQNSMELAAALVKYGKPFEFFVYPNRNHGIFGGMTRYHLFEKILKFALKIRDEKN